MKNKSHIASNQIEWNRQNKNPGTNSNDRIELNRIVIIKNALLKQKQIWQFGLKCECC